MVKSDEELGRMLQEEEEKHLCFSSLLEMGDKIPCCSKHNSSLIMPKVVQLLLRKKNEGKHYTPASTVPRRESDVMFFTHEAGARLVYDAGRAKKIISTKDLLPLWSMHVMHLRKMKLEEGGSLQEHIMEMMTCINHLEYIDENFDKDLVVDVLLESLPESYHDFSKRDYGYFENRTWIEVINLLRRYEESGAPAQRRQQLAAKKAKEEKGIGSMYHLDPQVGPSKKVADTYGWRVEWDPRTQKRMFVPYEESTASSPDAKEKGIKKGWA